MAALTWLPTTAMPEVGHIWTTDDTTCCQCHGTPTSTAQMTGKCLGCIQAYGEDVATLFRNDVEWRTRGAAPFRHGFWKTDLDAPHASPVCGFLPLATRSLRTDDNVIRCQRCIEKLRRTPPPAGREPDHDHQI